MYPWHVGHIHCNIIELRMKYRNNDIAIVIIKDRSAAYFRSRRELSRNISSLFGSLSNFELIFCKNWCHRCCASVHRKWIEYGNQLHSKTIIFSQPRFCQWNGAIVHPITCTRSHSTLAFSYFCALCSLSGSCAAVAAIATPPFHGPSARSSNSLLANGPIGLHSFVPIH